MDKNIRWKQRFTNLENAIQFLKEGLTYNREQATHAVHLIKERYFPGLEQVYLELKSRCSG